MENKCLKTVSERTFLFARNCERESGLEGARDFSRVQTSLRLPVLVRSALRLEWHPG